MRRTVLEGHRFTPPELLDAGVIDAVVDGMSWAFIRFTFNVVFNSKTLQVVMKRSLSVPVQLPPRWAPMRGEAFGDSSKYVTIESRYSGIG